VDLWSRVLLSNMTTWRCLPVMSSNAGFGFLGPNLKFSYDWHISNDLYTMFFMWLLMTSQVMIFSELDKYELCLFKHKSWILFIEKTIWNSDVLYALTFPVSLQTKTPKLRVTSVGKNKNFECHFWQCQKNPMTHDSIWLLSYDSQSYDFDSTLTS